MKDNDVTNGDSNKMCYHIVSFDNFVRKTKFRSEDF